MESNYNIKENITVFSRNYRNWNEFYFKTCKI